MLLPRALSIAGSDSGGGAGVQADLKTFTMLGVYGMTAVTAVTAQNTCGVRAVHNVPADVVRAQIDAVASDIGIDAAKTGMLPAAGTVLAVAAAVRDHGIAPLVVDPVMVAQSGAGLMDADAVAALTAELLPLATLLIPNLHEAQILSGLTITSLSDMRAAARVLIERGARAVLLKGGHLEGDVAVDIFDDGFAVRELSQPRIPTTHTHGTGCQLSAAITAFLARGLSLYDAVEQGKRFITNAIQHSLPIGRGCGPANPLAWKERGK